MAASMLSSSFSTKSPSAHENFSVRLHNVLNLPLPSKLYHAEALLKSTSTKDLRNVLPLLLENIFGFRGEPGWGLDNISKSYNYAEFDIARRLLSAEGPLLKLIYALQADPYLSYEFPVSCLPGETKRSLDQGGLPLFFASKIHSTTVGRPVLSLSAFEFYLFHFAYFLVNNQWQKGTVGWNNMEDFLYPALLQDYLYYYLPLERSILATRCPIPSPARTPVVSPSYMFSRQPMNPPLMASPRSPQNSLLRVSFNTSHQQQTYPSQQVIDQGQTEIWRCDTVVQVFTEFWLNQNSLEGGRQGTFLTQQTDTKMPSNNHLRVIRLFVKYLHYFANSAGPEVITSPYQQPTINPLDEFKRNVRQQHVQTKLYTFLRHAFDRWPLDMSFRLVLETWLSYIQPWRYCDIAKQNTSHDRLSETEENTVDFKWVVFIQDNLLFYTVLWQELLPRLYRMDLSSPFNAYVLFRAVKVLALPNLATMIDRVENMLYESGHSFSHMSLNGDLGGSFLPLDNGRVSLSHQLADMEVPGFLYQPLFCQETIPKVKHLLNQIIIAQTVVAALKEKADLSSTGGFLSWFSMSSLFQDDDSTKANGDLTATEIKKLELHLDLSLKKLCDIFRLPIPEGIKESDSFNSTYGSSPDRNRKSDSSNPDMEETDEGYRLSPLGRYQLVNGIRRFNCYYEGDPAEQPIQTYENKTLVRMLHSFCSFVNQQFGKNITEWCEKEGILGRMSHVYFAPPLMPNQEIQSPLSRQQKARLSRPRLNLRFLASYTNLLTLCFLYGLARLIFGFGPVGFLFLLSLLVLIVGFLKALVRPECVKLKKQ